MTRRLALVIAITAFLAVGARSLVAEPMQVVSGSMAPTLADGDHVLIDKRAPAPRRGDLVVFAEASTHELLIKRVVGVGGDTVSIEDGRLVVNGAPRIESYAPQRAQDGVYFGPVRVRPGTAFVLGDNRANSLDSRSFGAVATSSIVGRVVGRFWPPSRIGAPG